MKPKSTQILFILFTIGILITHIVGCGSDDDTPAEPTETSSTEESTEEVVIASSKPIDYDAEKQAIQEVFSTFYLAFNNRDMPELKKTWHATTAAEFAVVWVAGGFNEQVGPTVSWANVEATIQQGLWVGQGTAGQKWGNTNRLSEFWIRRKKTGSRELEASARGLNCFRPGAPGTTLVYLVKKNDKWLIEQIDSMTQPSLASRRGKPLISKYFTDPDAKAE
ncbi:hypothetical protein J4G08_03960 [Candidatus Poribacteria bacterium]|nr:hypothetical protein [Candidatus Poribacteria bacterium]